jgi:N utilization substance protein B
MNREKRKFVFEQLFMCEFYGQNEVDRQLDNLAEDSDLLQEMESDTLSEDVRQELKERAKEIFSRCDELDAQIDQVVTGWKTHRMGRAELAIIRLALYEMEYDDSIPYRVAINEAVELAKIYGGDDSPGFVNAVLGKLVKALNPDV